MNYINKNGFVGFSQRGGHFTSPSKGGNNKGFTLVELVAVIVILGILSVSVLPSYVDLSKDSKVAVLKSIAASMQTAAEHSYLKAKIYGVAEDSRSSTNEGTQIPVNGGVLELKYGYPEAVAEDGGLDIIDLMDFSEELEVCASTSCTDGNSSHVKLGYDTKENIGCYVKYTEPNGTENNNNNKFLIKVVETGC